MPAPEFERRSHGTLLRLTDQSVLFAIAQTNSKAVPVDLDDGKINQEVVDLKDTQGTSVDVEEFLRRYKAGERDFTGINLARAELSNTCLGGAILSEANLIGANQT